MALQRKRRAVSCHWIQQLKKYRKQTKSAFVVPFQVPTPPDMLRALLVLAAVIPLAASFNVSNTLGSHMVLQRAPARAVVWGFAASGVTVQTTVSGIPPLTTITGADLIWRQVGFARRPQPSFIMF